MRRLSCTPLLRLIVVLAFLNISFSTAYAASAPRSRRASAPDFQVWMSGAFSPQSSLVPSSPDNWVGGTGNWSNGADWSAGEPGSGSDVFINTGNDNVTLDTSPSINSLTLGGSTGSSTLTSSGQQTLTIAGSLTINQTGTLTFSQSVANVGSTATNAGTINLRNAGISATNFMNSGHVNLMIGSVSASTFTNTGSIVGVDSNTDSVSSGGDFNNSGGITAYNVGAGGTLTNSGGINAQNLSVGGNLINQGTILGLNRGSQFNVTGELTNSGRFDTSYSSATLGSLNNLNGGIVIIGGASTVHGNATNAGSIAVDSLGPSGPFVSFGIGGSLTNSGFFGVAGSGGASATAGVGSTNNSGIIEVDSLGRFQATDITNSGMIKTGVAFNGGGNTVVANTLTNLAGGIVSLGAVGDVGQFGFINNAGSVSIANGATLNVAVGSHAAANASPGFLNSGSVLVNSGGTLFSARTYTQTAGQTTVDGLLHVSGNGIINFAGGAVYGNGGTIQGNVISNAAFNMGDMPMTVGTMAIMGNYTQGANGSLAFDIASQTQYDQLNVSGRAQLNGTMFVDLLNGYVPQIGNTFDIMNFSSRSGTFSMVIGLPINGQEHFVLEYNSTNLTLDVVSGPELHPASGKDGFYYEPYVSDGTAGSNQLENYSSAPGTTVPEPGSVVLLCSGVLGIAGLARKRLPE